jgi:hypothetical protein
MEISGTVTASALASEGCAFSQYVFENAVQKKQTPLEDFRASNFAFPDKLADRASRQTSDRLSVLHAASNGPDIAGFRVHGAISKVV